MGNKGAKQSSGKLQADNDSPKLTQPAEQALSDEESPPRPVDEMSKAKSPPAKDPQQSSLVKPSDTSIDFLA